MKAILSASWILLFLAMPAGAHRLDEYLQATLLTVGKYRVQAQIRLIPGVAVLPVVLGNIDRDANESLSEAEQMAYAREVLRDLSLAVDGHALRLRLVSKRFPQVQEMKQGLGEITLDFEAEVPRGGGHRRLTFENHHESAIAAYLVNCLVPQDPEVQITAQNRNDRQSLYQVDYSQTGDHALAGFSTTGGLLAMVTLLLSARLGLLWRQGQS